MVRTWSNYRPIPGDAIKVDLPNGCQQETWTCGPAALLSICSHYGVGPEEEWEVAEDMGIDEEGSDPIHFERAAKKRRSTPGTTGPRFGRRGPGTSRSVARHASSTEASAGTMSLCAMGRDG